MRAMADTAELEALARAIPRVSWFAATATPLAEADRADGAAYAAALALAAHAGDQHPFAVKFRLYEAGRWPLGILGGVLHIL